MHIPPKTGAEVEIDQIVIGSCTNGRISDLRAAAEVLKGRKIKKGIRAIVFPATQAIYKEAIEDGTIMTLIEAGCVISTPDLRPVPGWTYGHTCCQASAAYPPQTATLSAEWVIPSRSIPRKPCGCSSIGNIGQNCISRRGIVILCRSNTRKEYIDESKWQRH